MADEDRQGRLTSLERRVEELSAQVQSLRQELANRPRLTSTMKLDVRCPCCDAGQILHAAEVLDRNQGRAKLSVVQPSVWRNKALGEFEIYICTHCGWCEWYVKKPGDIPTDEEIIRLIERGETDTGPYR
jgi:hypothetical protein